MRSIKEHSVSDEELGMFWRDTERSWWWYRAPIETQAMMIEAFDEVIQTCAEIPREGESGTWIIPEMLTAYKKLHELGHAHSIEVWEGDALIGGLYGVLLNSVFFAESMFSKQTDGSKMALAKLIDRAKEGGWKLIDCQFHTGHLESLGAREISRSKFLAVIAGC
jgi:leucyl/phenylalanyl-tRNA--protein transferase